MLESDALLSHGRMLLRRARQAGRDWQGLPPRLEQERSRDANEIERRQLAWALSYDVDVTSPIDLAVARRLLEDEVAWREVAPFQGIDEALEVACWIVSSAQDPGDVWLLARAKAANFDTELGLDREHLFCGDIERTLAYVQSSDHPSRDRVLPELVDEQGASRVSPADLSEWRAHKAAQAVRPQDEPLEVWIDRALLLGHRTEARALMQQWALGRERDTEFLGTYAAFLEQLGDYAEVADLRAARASLHADPFDRAGELQRATDAERLARRWVRALHQLEHAALMHRTRPQWRELGLGRELVRAAFHLAREATSAVAEQAFSLGKELAAVTPRLPPVALEHAIAAAQLVADEHAAAYYRKLLDDTNRELGRA